MNQLDNLAPINNNRLPIIWITLSIAVVFHLVILWRFKLPEQMPTESVRRFDVTLSAQAISETLVETKMPVVPEKPLSSEFLQKKPQDNKQQVKLPTNTPKKPIPATLMERKIISEPKATLTSPKPAIMESASDIGAERPKLSLDNLEQQVAQLGKGISLEKPNFAISKMKFVHEVVNHQFLASQYAKDLDDKIERTGNMNYPAAARNLKQALTLTMDIGINADGSLYSLRVVKSSGNAALDNAAKQIVKMSAPFAELPVELQREVNVLVIPRSWKFSDEIGLTTH